MKKMSCLIIILISVALFACACTEQLTDSSNMSSSTSTTASDSKASETLTEESALPTSSPAPERIIANAMTQGEVESIAIGPLSPEHEYYEGVLAIDPKAAEYITEMTIFDEEINDTFVIHISLPPNYSADKTYPMVIMTDGVWRLNDHPEMRQLMTEGAIEELILVSIGYPNGYDYETIRERDLKDDPESFLHFITDNVAPYMIEKYPVDTDRLTLTGHSYGGYFMFYAIFRSDEIGVGLFENYLVASPALQAMTGFDTMEDFEKAYSERNTSLNIRAYVTAGGAEASNYRSRITNLIAKVEGRNYDGLEISYEKIDNETHNSVFKPSLRNALIMFYGIENAQN
ncbi:MAG: alpha/beta hydrolase [Clostridiaceae bacterium]|nr:alpha/beta hydrolase [Clostridiaceae bacterium]